MWDATVCDAVGSGCGHSGCYYANIADRMGVGEAVAPADGSTPRRGEPPEGVD